MTKREELLLEFAKKFGGVFNRNMKSRVCIGGSLALKMQGYKTRRECGDVDFIIREHDRECILDVKDFVSEYFSPFCLETEPDEEYGEDVDVLMYAGEYKGEKIRFQVLYPNGDIEMAYVSKHRKWVDSVNDIMKAKIDYSLRDTGSSQKHRDDIVWFLGNNKSCEKN